MTSRHGQVALYLLLALIVICVLALSNVDSFLGVRAKNRLENAGDAAVLAAAHEQGHLLNEIGKLNLEHIKAAIQGDSNACAKVVEEQSRLALLGPFNALREANRVAKEKYELPIREEFAEILKTHISVIADLYRSSPDIYPEPYEGAWDEYLHEWLSLTSEGLSVGADNIEYFDTVGGHLLFSRDFYYAIAAHNWCWFHFNAESALRSFTSHTAWNNPFKNILHEANCANCEIFSLHIEPRQAALTDILSFDQIRAALRDYGEGTLHIDELQPPPLLTNDTQVWFCFDKRYWGQWFDGRRLAGTEDATEFPLDGEIKPLYNVRGCSAICRVKGEVPSTINDATNICVWVAAAKPFGSFSGDAPVTDANYLILPAFSDTRLIPVDAANGSDLASADYDWVIHQQRHLADYLERGPNAVMDCWYCEQLRTWEKSSFHERGSNWLNYNASSCVRPSSGTSYSGGTSHGH